MTSIEELQLFLHLASSGSYGRTSAACHVSQSALSRTINRLEAHVGVRLLDRDRRGTSLTEEGVRFRTVAHEIVSSWEGFATVDRGEDETPVRGAVSLYCSVTASQTLLPDILTRVRTAHPELRIDLQTGYAADALTKLDEGSAQLTVAPMPVRVPRHLLVSTLATTRLVPVASPEAAGVGRDRIDWPAATLVLPASGLARSLTDRWLSRARIRPSSVVDVVGHEAVLTLVAAGYGIGIVPDLVASQSPLRHRFTIRKPPPDLPGFDVALSTTPDHLANRAVHAFWNAARTAPAERSRRA
jgi:LysR family transcriptional regulator, positive regulator for ilvC